MDTHIEDSEMILMMETALAGIKAREEEADIQIRDIQEKESVRKKKFIGQ